MIIESLVVSHNVEKLPSRISWFSMFDIMYVIDLCLVYTYLKSINNDLILISRHIPFWKGKDAFCPTLIGNPILRRILYRISGSSPFAVVLFLESIHGSLEIKRQTTRSPTLWKKNILPSFCISVGVVF